MFDLATGTVDLGEELSRRHARERQFWNAQAQMNAEVIDRPVDMAPVTGSDRRPWHSYWHLYDRLLCQSISGLSVLVVGCGYGDDAIRLATLGARVEAFDLCPGAVEIARSRARRCHQLDIPMQVAAAEAMPYASAAFDLVFVNVVLHHCSVAPALGEIARVAKPGGTVLMREPYMHRALRQVRQTTLVRKAVGMRSASEDERPLDQHDVRTIRTFLTGCRVTFLQGLTGRIISEQHATVAAAEKWLYGLAPWCGLAFAAAIVVEGRLPQGAAQENRQ